jgi:hypothetical protein
MKMNMSKPNGNKPVYFEDALRIAVEKVKKYRMVFGNEIVLIRDLRGRIRVLLQESKKELTGDKEKQLNRFSRELSLHLNVYGFPPDRIVLFSDDLFQGDEVIKSRDRRVIAREGPLTVFLLDRQVTGQDWMRRPFEQKTKTHRITLFGIKGGVGRSTVLVVWAWRLAKNGYKVMVIDLDLESPGVTTTMLPHTYLPEYGIVDWFVEDGVGQAGIVEQAMVAESPLAKDLPGTIRIVPAYGTSTGGYLPKLSRCYAGIHGDDGGTWSERVQHMVETMELKEKPDVVFFDSRSGIHDIAAVLVTRMGAHSFLFAVESAQTWVAYAFLFKHWSEHPEVKDFRQKIQMVAGMVPETGRKEYLKRFQEKSWDLFRDHVYDEAEPSDLNGFSFDLADQEAPHYPLPVFWNRALKEFDPAQSEAGVDEKTAMDAVGGFMDEAEKMVFDRGDLK